MNSSYAPSLCTARELQHVERGVAQIRRRASRVEDDVANARPAEEFLAPGARVLSGLRAAAAVPSLAVVNADIIGSSALRRLRQPETRER